MRSLDLGDLDAFAAVAAHRSFRRAAKARGVSPSTLSQTVRDLEARLGVRLLNRTTRSVAPTEAGARLLERIGPALSEISGAVDQIGETIDVPAGTLRINAPVPVIELVLAPIVGDFLKSHPRIRLEIVAEAALIDIVAEGFDAGVRWGEELAQDVIAVPLGAPQRYVLAASPAFLETYGVPKHPRDFLKMPCLRQRYPAPSNLVPMWEFERGEEELRLDPSGPLVSTSITLQRQAAIEGVGVMMSLDGYLADDFTAGRLISLLEEWCPKFPGPFLYYPGNRHVPPALRAFVDFVRKHRTRGSVHDEERGRSRHRRRRGGGHRRGPSSA